MNRTSGGGPFGQRPDRAASSPTRDKRSMAAQILGQAYVLGATTSSWTTRTPSSRSPTTLVERRELFGDELVEMLDGAKLQMPTIDYASEDAWPKM